MAKSEFLQLAQVYKNQTINGWFASEKLDGQRCFWDGGITIGLHADEVPWANTARDARLKTRPVATGLWSRYGKVIHAPKAWLAKLPPVLLDGELYLGRQSFQELRKIIADHEPGPGWKDVRFMVFDMPPREIIFADRVINNTNFKKSFNNICSWEQNQWDKKLWIGNLVPFRTRYSAIKKLEGIEAHEQIELPLHRPEDYVEVLLDRITDNGGEGLILKSPSSLYRTCRDHNLLKVKPVHDEVGTVVGFVAGKLSDNTRTVAGTADSKLRGLIGSLVIKTTGPKGSVTFNLSGLTDEERKWEEKYAQWAWDNPGKTTAGAQGKHFKIGDKVTFRYREWSDDGVPKEARFFRK